MGMSIYRFALAIALLVILAGCSTMDGTAEYNYFQDELTSLETESVPNVHKAVLKALEKLEMPVLDAEVDELVSVVNTETADGTYFDIKSEWRSETSTLVSIEMYDYSERHKAMGLLEQIRDNLY
jgi:hypothetical protein